MSQPLNPQPLYLLYMQALSMKAPGFAAAMAAAEAYEEVTVNCGPNVQASYAVAYDPAAPPSMATAAHAAAE